MRPAALLLALLLPFATAAAPVLPEDPLLAIWDAPESAPVTGNILDLDDAVELALEGHPEIQRMRAEVLVARGELLAARAIPNPTWEVNVLSIAAERTSRVPTNFALQFDVSEVVQAQLTGAAAKPGIEVARLRLEEAKIHLTYETKAAYFAHQAALAAWSASLRSANALAASLDAQRAITAAGNASPLDLVRKEAAYEEARLRVAELDLDVVATRERLARLIGQNPGPISPFSAPPALSLPEDVEASAVAENLALRAVDAAMQAAERSQTAAKVDAFAPNVGVFFESERRSEEWEATAGLELSIPLLSFGRGDIARANAEVSRLAAERARIELEVRSAARETVARIESAQRRAQHYEEVLVPARDRVLQETLRRYNATQLGLDELLAAWHARAAIEVTLADTRREVLTAQAALEALLAGARANVPQMGH